MIKNFEPRLYQETIFSTATKKNTLVVLPTGMGKTNIFLMLAAHRLKLYPNSKILLLGPTRPLIDQYYETFKKNFEIDEKNMVIFTGFVSPEKRKELWKKAKIIFSTPQGLENDIISERINLEEVSLLGFDEAHRAVGDYAYVFVAKQYEKKAKYPKIIAMTASPGSDVEKISEVCKNLHIEAVEIRTDEDPDVKPYIQDIDITWVKVELPSEFLEIKKFLETCFKSKLEEMKKYGYVNTYQVQNSGKKALLGIQAGLQGKIAQGEKDFEILKSLSLAAEAVKIQHALELLETQGISPAYQYMEKLNMESLTTKVKAVQNLVSDLNFRSAFIKIKKLYENGTEHPKLWKLKELVEEQIKKIPDIKIIVFNQFRDSAVKIVEELNKIENAKAKIFVGQAMKKETGLSQKKQKEVLDEFREGKFNILVATSVAEEGLDIPKVDLVIFYEPIPSAIRHIQRRGRTGRLEKGSVIILLTKNTRDEGYRWSAHHKEKGMHRILEGLKKKFVMERREPTLANFIKDDEEVRIYADFREKGSGIIKELIDMGVKINLEKLEVGDYLLSSDIAVEYKTMFDFVDSLIDGRLLQQVRELKKYPKPLIVVEGNEDIYSQRNVHPNAIRGMLATITLDFNVPILYTRNPKDTAALLAVIAKRDQLKEKKEFVMHSSKPLSLKEQQEYIVSSLPGIGPTLSKPLLKQFKTIKKIVNASEEDLRKIDLIGEKKAKAIKDVVEREYEEN
jgi:ERCC4-related helicase